MQQRLSYLVGICILSFTLVANAEKHQSLTGLQTLAHDFLLDKFKALHGNRVANVSQIDPRLKLAACENPEAFLPQGVRLWSNTSVGIRCRNPTWSIYIPVNIQVSDQVVVAIHPIASGQTITEDDIELQTRDISGYADNALTESVQAIGKNTSSPIAGNSVLRIEQLRPAKIILQGQTVKIIAIGSSFKISTEGVAQGNASVGQLVSVKTSSGQMVKGIAKSEGIVEVRF